MPENTIPENTIPENENAAESVETEAVLPDEAGAAESETEENSGKKKDTRKPNHLLQIIAGGYLTYLGINLLTQLRKGAEDMEPRWLFIVASVLFVVFGGFSCIRSLITLYKENKANYVPYVASEEEETEEYADSEEYDDENSGE